MRDIILLDLRPEAGFIYRMRDIILLDLRPVQKQGLYTG